MPPKTRMFIRSRIRVACHPQDQQALQAMGCWVVEFTSEQTHFLPSLTVKDSLNDKAQKVNHEIVSRMDGLKEGLNCQRFINMNKTTEKPTPFGEEEHVIAARIDKTIRNAVGSFKAKHGASLKMKKLDVKNLNMLVSVMSAKKANGKFTSTPQTWHWDCKSDTIAQLKEHKNWE